MGSLDRMWRKLLASALALTVFIFGPAALSVVLLLLNWNTR